MYCDKPMLLKGVKVKTNLTRKLQRSVPFTVWTDYPLTGIVTGLC